MPAQPREKTVSISGGKTDSSHDLCGNRIRGICLEEYAQLEVHRGRLDQEDMRKLFEEKRPEVVIDATHPMRWK